MAETGRTDSVFWPVGSGRTADLGKETGKQRQRSRILEQTTAAVSCSTMES